MPRKTWVVRLAIASALLLGGAACRDDGVRISYRPRVGDTSTYEVRVRSSSLVRLPGQAPREQEDEVVLRAEHTVLGLTRTGSRVRVVLREEGGDVARTFVVRVDRAAQVSEVQEVDGLPARVLGNLGLAEIFPAAAGAAPNRTLRPGERWRIDEPVDLPETESVRLRGRGRLVELGVVGKRSVATVATSTELPVQRRSNTPEGEVTLDGVQRTESRTLHAIDDGSVESSESVTSARYELLLEPPDGASGRPLQGRLEVEVRSTTRRLR